MLAEPLSLRARLAGTMALLFLCATLALYLGARSYGRTAADRSYDRLLAGSALSIAETLSISGREVRVDVPYAALDMLAAAPDDRVFYRVFGPGVRTITGYDDLPSMHADTVPGATSSGVPEPVRFFDAPYGGERVRFALLGRQIAEPGVAGRIWVQVGQTRRAREALADELVLGALAPIGLMTVLALALVWFVIGRALRPLARISRDLGERLPSDLQPLSGPAPAEIVPLVEAINVFMRRLAANIDTLRAFIADAAHQMRTPLAALRAQAQMALVEDDPAALRRSLGAVERNAARLTRLLNQLLSDATVMHRSDLRRFERFDLLHVLRQTLREAVPLAGDGVEVRFDTALDEAPCNGDPVMVGEAVKNLIDNALRHGSAATAGPIEISLATEPLAYVIGVADRGPGIAAAVRARVFERFSRGEQSTAGAGLGLAIVRQVTDSHGGSTQLLERAGGGLQVQLRLPRLAP